MSAASYGQDEGRRRSGRRLSLTRGAPLPLGATPDRDGVNFAIFSRHACTMTLVLFLPGEEGTPVEFLLEPGAHRTGDIWHAFVHGLAPGTAYAYRADGPHDPETPWHRFDKRRLLLDPYARAVSGGEVWGSRTVPGARRSTWKRLKPRRARVVQSHFDWGNDQPPGVPLADSIIYELHVRGFTRHPSSQVAHPGTFLGLVEKIPYLQELGVTAVELIPITEFEENDNPRFNPHTGKPLINLWGYHPIALFAPKASYAASARASGQVQECKTMVKALHAAGIEVILDVVCNHTGEGDEHCPTWSYRGLDNATYYLHNPATGHYQNYTGCGNTLNCNHPVVQDLIIDCLRYWVTDMHVDGFRFDLAAILSRGEDGTVLAHPPVLERIAADPVLAHTKLIAEPWDAAGLYQVGAFPRWGRWSEWNDKFRDDIRRFVKGDPGMVSALATRLLGSPDLYAHHGGEPARSLNFITSHDGFTLADVVSYNHKHNEPNGEHHRDGPHENYSWNCGEEGPSTSPEVCRLRRRQMKNMVALLLLAQGVPMILSGDEMGRTQHGNNNAYCHDNEHSWVNWGALEQHTDVWRFFKLLIRFRKCHPVLRQRRFLATAPSQMPAVTWHGCRLGQPDWSWTSRSLAMHVSSGSADVDLYLLANAYWESLRFELPAPSGFKQWYRFIDTQRQPPDEIYQEDDMPRLTTPSHYDVGPRTVVVLVGK